MTIELIVVGKTTQKEVAQWVEMYSQRLSHYVRFSMIVLSDIRGGGSLSETDLKQAEGELILRAVEQGDFVVLLDEGGEMMTSVEFARYIDRKMTLSIRRLIFVVGGAFGFSDEMYARANSKLSLSPMTFSHQFIRAIFAEQLYRAFTIIRGEKYHH